MLAGTVSDRFGRKTGLVVSALLFAVSSVLRGGPDVPVVRRVAHDGRSGDRDGVGRVADVHRGSQPGAICAGGWWR